MNINQKAYDLWKDSWFYYTLVDMNNSWIILEKGVGFFTWI